MKNRRFLMNINTGYRGFAHRFPVTVSEKDCDIDNQDQVNNHLQRIMQQFINDNIDGSWHEVEPDEKVSVKITIERQNGSFENHELGEPFSLNYGDRIFLPGCVEASDE